jgi:hypothetical protein
MRKRRNAASRLLSGKVQIPPVDTVVSSTDKLLYGSPHSAEWVDFLLKVLSGVLIPLIVAAVTLFAAAWQFNTANERTDRARFLDGALATAQETNVLLGEGYNALEKLLNATDSHGWKAFSEGSFHDYMEFHRLWRQRAVSEHFKLTRYFGRDLADQLIHIDEIDLHPVDNLGSSNPCVPPGSKKDFDIEKMTFQTWCTITRIPLLQDVIDDKRLAKTDHELFETFREKSEQEEFAKKLLNHYDKATVGYLRQLNERITQLGQPQVTIVARPTDGGR